MEIVCYSFCWFLINVDQSKGGIFWIEEKEQVLLGLHYYYYTSWVHVHKCQLILTKLTPQWLFSRAIVLTRNFSVTYPPLHFDSQYVSVDSSTWIPYYFEVRQIWISKAETNRITSWISRVLKLFVKQIMWFDTK